MTFPDIDPIALQLGPLAIRWYALSYVVGVLLAYVYVVRFAREYGPSFTKEAKDNLIFCGIIGVMLGGRIGYVLFYQFAYFMENPLHILKLWEGGMSFHGGAAGVIVAFYIFAKKYKIDYLVLMDRITAAVPIGLGLGRIANFINGELYGRVTDSPLGMVFPRGGPEPRHPSQLYEAALEGLVLFVLLYVLTRYTRAPKHPGFIGGAFLAGYGTARFTVEFFREPDAQLGFLMAGATMGQLLCVPMILAGAFFMVRACKRPLAV